MCSSFEKLRFFQRPSRRILARSFSLLRPFGTKPYGHYPALTFDLSNRGVTKCFLNAIFARIDVKKHVYIYRDTHTHTHIYMSYDL